VDVLSSAGEKVQYGDEEQHDSHSSSCDASVPLVVDISCASSVSPVVKLLRFAVYHSDSMPKAVVTHWCV
jgi:hypothetical protein